jgi:Fn3 associated
MPTTNENFANDIRDAVKALMEADPYYFDIPILTERLQDLDAKIDETIQLSGGILILLVVVTLGKPLPNLRGAHFDDVLLVARVIENLTLNETGKGAQPIAIYTAALWNQLPPDTLAAKLELRGVDLGNDPRGLVFDTTASTKGGTEIEIPRLPELTIDSSDLAAIALAHATPGAVIFYTKNGSTPAPRNTSGGFLYLGTFNADPGTTIRARAWLPGYIPSAELRVIL